MEVQRIADTAEEISKTRRSVMCHEEDVYTAAIVVALEELTKAVRLLEATLQQGGAK